MYLKNIFRAYEWDLDDLLKLVMVLLTSYFFLVYLDYLGFKLELLQYLVSLVLFLFIPGTLILRLIRWDHLKSSLEIFLYTVGSSVALTIFLGFMVNSLLHAFGVSRPLTSGSFNSVLILSNYLICWLIYWQEIRRRNNYSYNRKILNDTAPDLGVLDQSKDNHIDLRKLLKPPVLMVLILPFLSVISSHMMTYYGNNLFSMILVIYIAIIVFLIGFKIFPSRFIPLAVFMIALALLYHKSLITNYIWGWDICFEYYMAQNVLNNGYWVMNHPNNYNSMLSVMILGPALSLFTGMNMIWVFKIVYPFLFALMPVGMYFIFKRQLTPTLAFLSLFMFMAMFTFYTEMLAILRQIIAELFLVLLILLLTIDNLNPTKRSLMAVVLSLALVVSHYGLSYIWMFALLFSGIFLLLQGTLEKTRSFFIAILPFNMDLAYLESEENFFREDRLGQFYFKLDKFKDKTLENLKFPYLSKIKSFRVQYLGEVIKPGWYDFSRPQSRLEVLMLSLGENIQGKLSLSQMNNFFTILLDQGASFSLLHWISFKNSRKKTRERILKYRELDDGRLFTRPLVLLFIIFLFTWYMYTSSSSPLISILNVGNDIFSNILSFMDPNASQGLSMVLVQQKSPLRDLHKNIYLVSQFFVGLGVLALLLKVNIGNFRREYKIFALAAFILMVAGILVPFLASQINTSRLLHMALIFLSPFFMVGIFFIFTIIKSRIKSLPVESVSMKFATIFLIVFLLMDTGLVYQFVPSENGISIAMDTNYDFPKFNQREVQSTLWVKSHFAEQGIYGDKHRATVLRSFMPYTEEIPPYADLMRRDYYLYLGTPNILRNGVYIYQMTGANVITEIGYINPQKLIAPRPKLYDNGGAWIFGAY